MALNIWKPEVASEYILDVSSAAKKASSQLQIFVENLIALSRSCARSSMNLENYDFDAHKVRPHLVKNLTIYRKDYLEATKVSIIQMINFLSTYSISLDTFIESFDLIDDDVKKCAMHAETMAEMYSDLCAVHSKLADTASEYKELVLDEIRNVEILEDKVSKHANYKRKGDYFLAAGLLCISFVPCVPLMPIAAGAAVVVAAAAKPCSKRAKKAKKRAMKDLRAQLNDSKQTEKVMNEIGIPISTYIKNCSIAIGEVAVQFRIICQSFRSIGEYKTSPREFAFLLENHFLEMKEPARTLLNQCRMFQGTIPLLEERMRCFELDPYRFPEELEKKLLTPERLPMVIASKGQKVANGDGYDDGFVII